MGYLDWPIALLADHSLKLSLVTLRPLMDGQLGDFDSRIVDFLDDASNVVLVLRDLLDRAVETTPPWEHRDLLLPIHQQSDIRNYIFRVIARDVRAPTGTDTFSTVNKYHGENWKVMLWLYRIVVVLEVVEEGVIVGMEDCSRDRGGFCEDIPGRGVVLASLVSGAELPVWHQEVKVVTADVILSQVDDRHGQTLFSVVVSGVFGDVTDELRHL